MDAASPGLRHPCVSAHFAGKDGRVSPDAQLPDADYVLLGSRIALGLDGGFAVAVPARLRLLEAAGAREPLMLSVDGQSPEAHAAQRQAFVDGGHVSDAARVRNLFDELVADPSWLS